MADTRLAAVFADTQRLYSTEKRLSEACAASRARHRVYTEGHFGNSDLPARNAFSEETKVSVSRKRTFEAAESYARAGLKTCALNFANSVHPGGGVVHGARAQEECLCRISTLYDSLISPEMNRDFYSPHRKIEGTLANDDAIFTPGVVVFKSDTDMPALRPEGEWFSVDVVTCAAPCLGWQCSDIGENELLKIHESRARQILSVALENGEEALILGAFGCGAFRNPPKVVAKAYKNILPEFKNSFKVVEFAVYCSPRDAENFTVFESVFGS